MSAALSVSEVGAESSGVVLSREEYRLLFDIRAWDNFRQLYSWVCNELEENFAWCRYIAGDV